MADLYVVDLYLGILCDTIKIDRNIARAEHVCKERELVLSYEYDSKNNVTIWILEITCRR
jgi:hypothetical protein